MNDRTYIGTFYGVYDIYVYTNDYSDVPHFHILDARNRDKRYCVCCVEITEPRYFDYLDGQHKLTEPEIFAMMEMLQSPHFGRAWMTKWEYLVYTWNVNNYSHIEDMKMPDYTNL